jgi:hypothetical protein
VVAKRELKRRFVAVSSWIGGGELYKIYWFDKAAFDEAVIFVLDDAANAHFAEDSDCSVVFCEQLNKAVSSCFDPTSIVGGHAVALIKGALALRVGSPNGVQTV